MKYRLAFCGLLASLLAGCASFTPTHTNVFLNEEGFVVGVENGTRSKDHVFKVVSPGNGKEVEFASSLMVRVTLPDGDRIVCYQTLNDKFPIGTMYMTDDKEWIYITNGLMCRIYEMTADRRDYLLVFEGNLAKGKE